MLSHECLIFGYHKMGIISLLAIDIDILVFGVWLSLKNFSKCFGLIFIGDASGFSLKIPNVSSSVIFSYFKNVTLVYSCGKLSSCWMCLTIFFSVSCRLNHASYLYGKCHHLLSQCLLLPYPPFFNIDTKKA